MARAERAKQRPWIALIVLLVLIFLTGGGSRADIASLPVLRGVAVLLVLMRHSFELVPGGFGPQWLDDFFGGGYFGVDIFFVLSGFLPRVLALLRWVGHTDEKGEPVYTSALPWFYQHVCKNISSDLRVGSFVYAICFIAFFAILANLLDKKKIYIKV